MDAALITIIAGGRDYNLTLSDEAWLDTLPIREVVSGGASGVDAGGEAWASLGKDEKERVAMGFDAGAWRRVVPFPLATGTIARVTRLRGYGNAIVPQVAATFIRAALM